MMSLVLHDTTLSVAFHRVEQTLEEIAAVVTGPATLVADLEHVAALSTTAWEVMGAMVRPYLSDAVAYYQFRTTAQACCMWGHLRCRGPQYRLRPLRPRQGARSREPVEALLEARYSKRMTADGGR